ncbi:MAG: NAD-glutamate dehydrogenase, partial [Robiginitomaculum sp.]|nr:NAD-glutamate dehydrogenase [Robiginitomaculum sp.]
ELRAEHIDSRASELFAAYANCFTVAYKEHYNASAAVQDISDMEQVALTQQVVVNLSTCYSEVGAEFSFKVFSYSDQLFLSDVAPILENLGLNIIGEKTFSLQLNSKDRVWLHDFSLYRKNATGSFTANSKKVFEDAFTAIWTRQVDDDKFNELVTTAEIVWRDASLLRAYASYLKQIKFGYSVAYIAQTLSNHGELCRLLVQYFNEKFDPANSAVKIKSTSKTRAALVAAIDNVTILSEDSVLRSYLNLIDSTLRTNYFQLDSIRGKAKEYVSFKLNPEGVQGMPLPSPKFEIYVFSRRIEGVHLRGGKVARGGLRWSDRREDYRTEVLGLVKAQQVKNSVIVPVGAKGGFVIKEEPASASREDFMRLGIECYKTFIKGLLDITDNIVDGKLVPPKQVVRCDEDDPYLVVAADKGTATFSDIANGIADDYGFWLGDGFASGGSNGYDHKQMGITAKGAWVSVQRHFREMGVDVQKQDFSVVGIGDMSGDVFGNGMLLSRHICLVAAFNHLHIFIDPTPDSARSFKERAKLFKKIGSSWSDYDEALISKGGGIFSRKAKSISISPQMKSLFQIKQNELTPDQLISKVLTSPVDLLWNGGIGTYAKSSAENHAEVGDKANDNLRVNGKDLQCKVIGEGGNLGFTQLGRIEYAMSGGVSLTDFIDNSAGVDCSDHEVNIKILLNELSQEKGFSEKKRNQLLESMTEDVSTLVLRNNYSQVQAIGLAHSEMIFRNKEYADLIVYLENNAGLVRELEFLPSQEQMEERSAKQQHLTRPEISVLTSYMKMHLKQELVVADYIDDEYLQDNLFDAFPAKLKKRYSHQVLKHPLRRELVSTQLANSLVNLVGPSFIYRMVDSTGASPGEVVKAALIARDVFQIPKYWSQIEALDYKISASTQDIMMTRLTRLLRRATRWLLRNKSIKLEFESANKMFLSDIEAVRKMLPAKLPADFVSMFAQKRQELLDNQVPEQLATNLTQSEFLFPATSFIQVSHETGEKLAVIVEVYYAIGEELQLNWLGKMINQLHVTSNWQALARETYLDDLSWQQRALTANIVSATSGAGSADSKVQKFCKLHQDSLKRARTMITQLQSEAEPEHSH